MSRLLLDEHPLMVMPNLAVKIGLNEAMILQQIHYWNEINRKSNNNYRDGYYWTFNSYVNWGKQFPFWNKRTIQRAISNLEKYRLVVTGNYNKLKIDRTKWYRIDYKALEHLENAPCGQNGTINMTKWLHLLDKLYPPLPETNTENKSKITLYALSSAITCEYIQTYLKAFTHYLHTEHPRVRKQDVDVVEDFLLEVESDVELFDFERIVTGYFEDLPQNNNGNILAFIKAWPRVSDMYY